MPSTAEGQHEEPGMESSLPCGQQETNHSAHHLPESALTGSESGARTGMRPRLPVVERQRSAPWLNALSLPPSLLQSPYSGCRHPSPRTLGVWTGLQGPFVTASACAGGQSIKTSVYAMQSQRRGVQESCSVCTRAAQERKRGRDPALAESPGS